MENTECTHPWDDLARGHWVELKPFILEGEKGTGEETWIEFVHSSEIRCSTETDQESVGLSKYNDLHVPCFLLVEKLVS